MSDFVYMMISKDEYELPEAVAGNAITLARICGTTKAYIERDMLRAKRTGSKPKFIKVDVSEEASNERVSSNSGRTEEPD